MRDVLLLPAAREDIISIVEHLYSMGSNPRKSLLSDLRKCLGVLRDGIVEYPFSRIDSLAAKGYCSTIFGKYVLLYYVEGDAAVVAHIFHQRQDYARLVTGGER